MTLKSRRGGNTILRKSFDLLETYEILLSRWGPQHWWPGDSQMEIVAGALLAQATNWNNAAAAVANLKHRGLLKDSKKSFNALCNLSHPVLEEAVRPSGYFRQKAERLRRLITFLGRGLGPPPWKIPKSETLVWRERLTEIKGLGPETVDSILLYGFDLPLFVVDAYTRRLLSRHGMIAQRASYDDIRLMFEQALPERSKLYNEYHALIVRLGKEHCRSNPRCDGCPLLDRG